MDKITQLLALFGFMATSVIGCSTMTPGKEPRLEQLNQQAQSPWVEGNVPSLATMTFHQLQDDLGIKSTGRQQPKQPAAQSKKQASLNLSDELTSLIINIAKINKRPPDTELSRLASAIESNQLAQYIENILPQYDQVARLRAMIQHYKTLATGPWPTLTVKTYKLGQSSPQIATLRSMLTQLGDLAEQHNTKYRRAIFDPVIIESIKTFQQRHGIEVTGELNIDTITALNISPQNRIGQMQLNLWRWFELPPQLPQRYLWVNIPEYDLKLYNEGELALNMPVIVGKPKSPTPIFSTHLTRLTINPTWTPPQSIVRSELLPRHGRQPAFLKSQAFELHNGSRHNPSIQQIPDSTQQQLAGLLGQYRLVQAPGPKNALGQYRFSIPSNDAIYLHDTPAKYLFAKNHRALSHGCIRLADATGLSQYLFKTDSRLKAPAMKAALQRSHTKYFTLANPMPVFITYHTSWVDAQGKLQVRPDIYHLDKVN